MTASNPSSKLRGKAEPVKLPASLTFLCGADPVTKADARKMRQMLAVGRKSPQQHYNALCDFMGGFFEEKNVPMHMATWGLDFGHDSDLVKTTGRSLEKIPIITGQGHQQKCHERYQKSDWTMDVRATAAFRSASCNDWILFQLANADKAPIEDFLTRLKDVCKKMDIRLGAQHRVTIPEDKAEVWLEIINRECSTKRPKLVLCMLPDDKAQRYSALKTLLLGKGNGKTRNKYGDCFF